MPHEKYSRKVNDQLVESIRIQKSRRKTQTSLADQSSRLVKDMVSEMDLMLDLQEITHNKLARELHDGLTQTVAALAMRVNFARRMLDSDPEAALLELQKVEDLARDSVKEIRHMIFILRPGERNSRGISAALDSLAENMSNLFNLEIDLSIDLDIDNKLGTNTQLIVYSIVEEAVDNARNHAGAEHIWVNVSEIRGIVRVDVEDDGEKLTLTKDEVKNRELENMQKLADLMGGTVRVDPIEGKGNHILVEIPLLKFASQSSLSQSE